jgi:hypothetical protein
MHRRCVHLAATPDDQQLAAQIGSIWPFLARLSARRASIMLGGMPEIAGRRRRYELAMLSESAS